MGIRRSLPSTPGRTVVRSGRQANICSHTHARSASVPVVALSYDRPSTPLHEVTFCVVDRGTTGASASSGAITEVGAAKFRGGTCLGTFQTLVDAGVPMTPVAARIT